MPTPAKLSALLLLAALAACTPRQACIHRAMQDYRQLQEDIRETEENLARGYATQRRTIPRTVLTTCYRRDPATGQALPYTCTDVIYATETIRIPIDRAREARKLAAYRRALPAAKTRAEAGVRHCEAAYPEAQ